MRQLRTRGQPAALEAVGAAAAGRLPHAALLVGPPSIGKTTLALDIAAALLCLHPERSDRPCGACRGCRLVHDGNHPDLHRLRPAGPGGQIGIAQVRELSAALALLPVEGGARVAVIESAHRLNEDAQNALLKTLEEPPAGVTILLAADDEERLLPTVHSRCVTFRLGPTGSRDIEALVTGLGLADSPTAARLARIAAGRPGLAVAYARAPEAAAARSEVARVVLDLLGERPARRLAAARDLLATAGAATAALDAAAGRQPGTDAGTPPEPAAGRRRGRGGARADAISTAEEPASGQGLAAEEVDRGEEADGPPAIRTPAAARRRAAAWLIEAWRDVARDLALAASGNPAGLRMPELLEEYLAAASVTDAGEMSRFLVRCVRAAERIEANVSPELEIDTLVLAWPTAPARAATTTTAGARRSSG